MTQGSLQHKETLLLEILLSGLDAREGARTARMPMLVYLADLLICRVREELETVRTELDAGSPDATAKRHKGGASG